MKVRVGEQLLLLLTKYFYKKRLNPFPGLDFEQLQQEV